MVSLSAGYSGDALGKLLLSRQTSAFCSVAQVRQGDQKSTGQLMLLTCGPQADVNGVSMMLVNLND